MRKFAVVILILAAGYSLGSFFPLQQIFFGQHQVEINTDIELPRDFAFKESNMAVMLKAGTKCTQTLKKGALSYLQCSVVVPNKFVL